MRSCVNNCTVCPQDILSKAYKGIARLNLEDFKKALENTPKDVTIQFAGFSEPFTNPDCPQMIRYAYEQGYKVSLFTTVVGLTLEGLNIIKDCKFTRVALHLPDNRGYAKIRTTQTYKDVLAAFMQTLEVTTYMSMNKRLFLDNERAGNTITASPERHIYGAFYCSKLLEPEFILLPNCDITLCCMDYGLKHQLGNLLTETYDDIQNSSQYKKICSNRFRHDGDTLCRSCAVPSRIYWRYVDHLLIKMRFRFKKLGTNLGIDRHSINPDRDYVVHREIVEETTYDVGKEIP